jgi:hypothetical protein
MLVLNPLAKAPGRWGWLSLAGIPESGRRLRGGPTASALTSPSIESLLSPCNNLIMSNSPSFGDLIDQPTRQTLPVLEISAPPTDAVDGAG